MSRAAAALIASLALSTAGLALYLRSSGEGVPRLVTPDRGSGFAFEDRSSEARISHLNTAGTPERWHIPESNGQGVCWLDYDGDGDPDIFLPNGSTSARWLAGANPPDALYRNNGNGSFTDVTFMSDLAGSDWSFGAAAADYDGDGDEDLYVCNFGKDHLYRNDGNGHFVEVAAQSGLTDPRWSSTAAFGDLDGDGWLDIFVTRYCDFDPSHPKMLEPDGTPCDFKGVPTGCPPGEFKPLLDSVYRNRGDGRFEDQTVSSGLAGLPRHKGMQAVIADIDGDGKLDVYVANDLSANQLLLNRSVPGSIRFQEVGVAAGCAIGPTGIAEAGMGVALLDFDGSGLPSILVTNFADETVSFYRNLEGRFRYDSYAVGLGLPETGLSYVSWGIVAEDFNDDGIRDLMVSNGHTWPQVDQVPGDVTYRQPLMLLAGDGVTFHRVPGGEILENSYTARGLAVADYDGDGDLDALVGLQDEAPLLLTNLRPSERFSLRLRVQELSPAGHWTDALGARVTVEHKSGRRQHGWLTPHASFMSSHEPVIHFGLGSESGVANVRVRWPDGSGDDFGSLGAGFHVLSKRER